MTLRSSHRTIRGATAVPEPQRELGGDSVERHQVIIGLIVARDLERKAIVAWLLRSVEKS
jgi:hypothetical protein